MLFLPATVFITLRRRTSKYYAAISSPAFRRSTFDISQIINAPVGEIFQRTNTTSRQFESHIAI